LDESGSERWVRFRCGNVERANKFAITRRLKRKQTRDALYGELGHAYHVLSRANDLGHEQREDLNEDEKEERLRTPSAAKPT